jgi:hypothetical protein
MSKPNLPAIPYELLETLSDGEVPLVRAYAEEAVRQALAAQVRKVEPEESFDHMRPNLDRGIPGSFKAFSHWVMNHPDDRIYVHSAHEGFYAGIKWCRQQSDADMPESRDG